MDLDDTFEQWKRTGDDDSFSVLWNYYLPTARKVVRAQTRSSFSIEDALQEVVVVLLRRRSRMRELTDFYAIVLRYAQRRGIDVGRFDSWADALGTYDLFGGIDPHEALRGSELRELLYRCMDRLPNRNYFDTVELKIVYGYKVPEIARLRKW